MQVWIRFVVPCFHRAYKISWSQCPCSSMILWDKKKWSPCTKQWYYVHFFMLDFHPTHFCTFHLGDSVMGLPLMWKYLWIRNSVKLFPTFKKLQKFGKICKQLTFKAIILIFMGPLPMIFIQTNFTVQNILYIQKSGHF